MGGPVGSEGGMGWAVRQVVRGWDGMGCTTKANSNKGECKIRTYVVYV